MNRRKKDPPRGMLKVGSADSSRLRHERYHASPDLDPFVEHFWLVEWDLRGSAPERAETLPHPCVHMIFETAKSRIRGPARAKFATTLEGKGGVFAVKFRPAGFYPFARVAVSRFADTIVRLRDVFDASVDELNLAVLAERSDETRMQLVEAFLRARMPAPDENVSRINEMTHAIANQREILKVDDLVERYAIHKRTLQRLFVRYVGVSPKWVIQRYRLHEAAAQLGAGTRTSQASLALELGYSDQSHFVRDFKAIVGMSPAAFARAISKR